jgi:cell division protein FtsB
MATNRRNQSGAIYAGSALKAFGLCLFVGGAGLGYVWQKNQIFDLGQRINKQEVQLETLKRQNKLLQDQLDFLRSPPELEERIRRLNLGLARPQPERVVRLVEPCNETNVSQSRAVARLGNLALAGH